MASKDFVDLMTRLHKEKHDVLRVKINADRVGEGFSTTATIVLRKGEEQVTLVSSEVDFILYVIELRRVADVQGEYRFRRVRDPEQYATDIQHLVDQDHSKVKEAAEKIRSGEFTFAYSVRGLIDELLSSERNVRNKKFLPLKRDYHHILADALLTSDEMLKAHKRLANKYPEAKKTVEAVDAILRSFMPTNNAVKDYRFYRRHLGFHVDELSRRVSTELPVADDTVKDFMRRGKIDAAIAVPKVMDVYGRLIELLAPVLDLLRIGLELKRGNASPSDECQLGQNIRVLKADPLYGSLFGCLDEQVRHSDAHVSRHIDKTSREVRLLDARGRRERIVSTYTFDEFTDMVNVMQNQFFPAVFPTFVLFDTAMLDLLLASPEYRLLVLAIGNV